jgi:hypothetical protein
MFGMAKADEPEAINCYRRYVALAMRSQYEDAADYLRGYIIPSEALAQREVSFCLMDRYSLPDLQPEIVHVLIHEHDRSHHHSVAVLDIQRHANEKHAPFT